MMVKKASKFLLKFAILAVALNEVAAGAVAPAMDVLIKTFDGVYDATLVMLITTAPQICLIVFAPLFGAISNKFKRRHLLFFSLICFMIGGAVPAACIYLPLTAALPLIIALRIIMGIGISILLPLSLLLIDDFFGDTGEKHTLIGLNQTMQMVGGTLFQLMGGYLAVIQWNLIFLVYLFPIWIIVLCFFVIPEPKKKLAEVVDTKTELPAVKEKLPTSLIFVAIGYVCFHIVFFNLVTNTAVLADQIGFDAASAGVALSGMTVGSFFAGIAYGFLYKYTKRTTMAIGTFLVCAGFAINFFAADFPMVIAGCAVAGIGMGISMPAFMSTGTEGVPASRVGMSLSWLIAAMGLGQFLSPFVFNPILAALGLNIGRDGMGLAAVLALILAVLYLIYGLVTSRKKPETA